MSIKHSVTELVIKSVHMGFLSIARKEDDVDKPTEVWLEVSGTEDFPLIIETEKDIDELCKVLQDCKKLLKIV